MTIDPEPTTTRSTRPWWRRPLSVRVLMGLILVVGLAVGWYARSVASRREAVATIRAAGGTVAWRDENGNESDVWGWLYRRTGWEFAREVGEVSLVPSPGPSPALGQPPLTRPTRADLFAALGRLGQIRSVHLDGLTLTPAERATLAASQLESLRLQQGGRAIPDQALIGLDEIPTLRSLDVSVGGEGFDPSHRPSLSAAAVGRIGKLNRLRYLAVTGFAEWPATDPATLGQLDHLVDLLITPSPRDGAILDRWGASGNFRSVNLPTTRVTDDQLRRLVERHSDLDSLILNGALLTDRGIEALTKSSRIQILTLQGRPGDLPGLTDAALVSLGRLNSLRGLTLTCGRLTDQGLDALAGSARLQYLELGEFATLNNAALTRLVASRSWWGLGFRGSGVTDATLATILANVRTLESLSLSFSGVTDSGIAPLTTASIGRLNLTGTAVSLTGLTTLARNPAISRIIVRGLAIPPEQLTRFQSFARKRWILVGPIRPEDE